MVQINNFIKTRKMTNKKNKLKTSQSIKKKINKKFFSKKSILSKQSKSKEIELLNDKIDKTEEKYLRLRAEYENYIKRNEKEISRILKYDGEHVLKTFLSILDDLDRVVESSKKHKNNEILDFINGIVLIKDKLLKKLDQFEVATFDSEGVKFDPDLHDAMMTKESKDYDDGIIIEEFEKGYKYKDKVIRHSKVIVNSIGNKGK
ncbi:MAG: nucleotide exchange factor GrpE [Candidatus Marinimicrobia bacterium]|nr:nucleotide exchange factor GrpE [Candidatus Neomarinimicrobiota bacterium]